MWEDVTFVLCAVGFTFGTALLALGLIGTLTGANASATGWTPHVFR